MSTITNVKTYDFRFPTSQTLSGSDAMNPDPDYSTAYVEVETDADDGIKGTGFVFTIGRGNDVVCRAIDSMSHVLLGRNVEELLDNMRLAWDLFVGDSQLRWLGPEKGVEHMAIGAVLSALWDIKAKRAGKPLWMLLAQMDPEELVATLDFRYLTDALRPEEAIEILQEGKRGKDERIEYLLKFGYPGYSTAAGWLGYADEKMVQIAKEETEQKGFKQIKLKVGRNVDDDLRRLALAREAIGPDVRLAVDANQVWDVPEAIEWINKFHDFDLAWVEEPTSPDDVIGHATIARAINPIPVATGEQMQNRIMFKQYLQANAFGVMQIDATRVAGPQEVVLEYLMAKKFNKIVCPHAGGVGLCEAVCHFAMFDYVAVSGTMDGRMIEYVDNQHEYFVHPIQISEGNYVAPTAPGNGTEMTVETAQKYLYRG
ncbi:Mandelate racemase/muconate lactonizing enzyme, C-terminal domain protein [Bifidobacterium actinocoloniiforme DSM 22766]|uniref:L-fuconate dehydratase n=1 Tax=Bifidobacterium actinocoloniiforme DSM 22766 TaxID=1437605 RepID=A0A086Z1M4_9BIFI|nr:enolase C-terminal domain-like protein [Bifidobacterium actinocoloniiforme]AKV55549.1 fuconate dehydratase [Bifidobacterium actinocoloniiforme DSM 22766]KFI40424.1 Mandelate racemase/muconate lactonizing enzyme, C-terminal domain protein [Bifidobacterium actinocoloniiforme DSM 22766]